MKPNWEVQHILNEGRPAVSLGRSGLAEVHRCPQCGSGLILQRTIRKSRTLMA